MKKFTLIFDPNEVLNVQPARQWTLIQSLANTKITLRYATRYRCQKCQNSMSNDEKGVHNTNERRYRSSADKKTNSDVHK